MEEEEFRNSFEKDLLVNACACVLLTGERYSRWLLLPPTSATSRQIPLAGEMVVGIVCLI